jgi:hypothetical protein
VRVKVVLEGVDVRENGVKMQVVQKYFLARPIIKLWKWYL